MADLILWKGKAYRQSEAARLIGITPTAMRLRLRNWTLEQAMTTPADKHRVRASDVGVRGDALPAWMQKLGA